MDTWSQFFFQHAAEGILIVSANSELKHINPAAVSMLAVRAEDCLGKPIADTFRAYPLLVRLLRFNGPTASDVPLPNERLATGVAGNLKNERVVLLHDVTERREIDSRREALVKRVAHDLRNPLNALDGYTDLVAKLGEVNPQQQKFLTRIRQTTTKLYEMAAKLVDLSWIEAGMPMEHVPVELAHLTREAIRELAGEAQRRQITIVNSIPNELPTVMGDPARLKQTIFNLLDNAIRYSHAGGNVVIHAWHQDQEVHYTVADRGIGIAEDEQDKIWDRLWRSNDERVRDIPGGGIGLSFAQTIIGRHGGRISVTSKLNEGSTFSFSLPLSRGK